MKKALLVFVVLAGLLVAADLVIVKFWPDTKIGEYAANRRDVVVQCYCVTKDFWVEQWHRFRPEEPEPHCRTCGWRKVRVCLGPNWSNWIF